ncbi:MAG: serine/threonine protein kinase [Acidobacteriia bacterium]|nr:serine/threonine protein kinase [Terriglobia bacterium]
MRKCPSCSRTSAGDGRFCPWCAAALDVTSAETAVLAVPAATSAPRLSSSSSVDEGRFLPGTMLAGRYRIASLLGRGGMGEVYRATDLTLGQAVALKFLPETMARDEHALARFYNEVRMARQVTHPNVCRVYDIGQVEGLHYISMEYIDGEDLASLLRRIGRLPVDKATETARKLCAGLGAAHEKGVLHRDLKPANVMIDGRGQVIVMDFGLAGLSEQLHQDIRSGTPAYMAPEQLAGTEVTARSDIYALGLLLYELYTGKRAFEAASLMELVDLQQRAQPRAITETVKELDPAVERVILRCLEPDPRRRPASALAVAAGLPGGDVLAAAMAAGETPSPDVVAAAGDTEGLQPRIALIWLAATLAAIVLAGIAGAKFCITARVPLEAPPEALARDARNLLKGFGYSAKPGDAVWGFDYNSAYQGYLSNHRDAAARRWRNPAAGLPPVIDFWYRESPHDIVAVRHFNVVVNYGDPPLEMSGMARLKTDSAGNLRELEAVPPQVEAPAPATGEFDWGGLFRAAGLDPAAFQPVEAQWTPLANWDTRRAWTGADPPSGAALRVEAAAWRGRPVFFRILGPWSSPERSEQAHAQASQLVIIAIVYTALIAACLIAWYNLRAKKGDRRGAARLGIIYALCMAGRSFLTMHHAASQEELSLFWDAVASAALNAGMVALFYLALEPWVRRRWPQTVIGWSRFTTRGIRDPLVGRDLLYGAGLGSLWASLVVLQVALHGAAGEPIMPSLASLGGVREAAGTLLQQVSSALSDALLFFFLLFLIRLVLRKEWLTALGFIVTLTVIFSVGTRYPLIDWPTNALFAVLYAFMLLRFGLVVLIAADGVSQLLLSFPRTLDFSAWHAPMGMVPLVVVALIAIYGFRISLAGRPLLREELF